MATISLRLSDRDSKLFKSYADFNNQSLSEMIRIAVIEKIENEYDLKVFEEYERDKENGNIETRPIEDFWKELGL